MENTIKELVLSGGADVCGIADISRFRDAPKGFSPKDLFNECQSVIAFGIALPKGLTKVESRLIYGHFNYNICLQVDKVALTCAKAIENKFSAIAVPVPCDSPYEYWEEDNLLGKGLISMKHTAVQCGLGSLGKNGLLINKQYGNLLNIGAILTNLTLQSNRFTENLCIDGCTKCIDNCPTHAIENGTVNQKLCRLHTYGKTARGFDTVDCNICRTICPMRYGY